MEEACGFAVKYYHERVISQARKKELLKDPNVQEALKLFGVNVDNQE